MNKKTIISEGKKVSFISASDDIIFKLKVLAKEKEDIRKKLAVTAEALRLKAEALAVIAKEKEDVRKKLEVMAEALKMSRETLEEKVLERTKDLKQTRARDEAILASIGDGLVVVDKEGKIVYVNKAFENLLGWRKEEVVGKSMVEVVPREDEKGLVVPFAERILSIVLSHKTTTTTTTTTTWYYTRKDKSRIPVSTIITPVVLGGKIIGAVETFRDITKEKEVEKTKEKQLRHEIEIETKVKDFISMASHQLLTPLTLIKGYISMLISGKLGKIDEEARKYLEESLQGGERMSSLVKSLLTTSRIESGNIKIVETNFDLDEVMRSVAVELKPKLEGKKLDLELPSPKKLMVFADKEQTREALMNVLDNAIKYTEIGVIIITESQTDSMGIVSIKDSGIGINQKDLPHIFEKFYSSENWLQKQSESHGLGLYIAKLLLTLMDATIEAESKIGEGSVFTISLPRALKNGKNTTN